MLENRYAYFVINENEQPLNLVHMSPMDSDSKYLTFVDFEGTDVEFMSSDVKLPYWIDKEQVMVIEEKDWNTKWILLDFLLVNGKRVDSIEN